MMLLKCSNLTEAQHHIEQALAYGMALYGAHHPQTAIYMQSLGLVLQQLGRLEEARTHFANAQQVFLDFFGPTHPRAIKTAEYLAQVEAQY